MLKVVRFFISIACLAVVFVLFPTPTYAIDRIGIRQGANGGEFYDTVTNAKFVPRGNNYVIVGSSDTTAAQHQIQFDPKIYNSTKIQDLLTQFSQNGYNAVRIFMDDSSDGNTSGNGLSSQFMDNVADFLQQTAHKNIYTLIALATLPSQGGYWTISNPAPGAADMDGWYNLLMMNQSYIDAKKQYIKDFIAALQARNVPMASILGYEPDNEYYFRIQNHPFTLTKIVQTAAGSFNMADANQRQQAMDANLKHWAEEVNSAVKAADPNALTTLSFADSVQAAQSLSGAIKPSVVFGDSALLDFFDDIHLYPILGAMADQMSRWGIPSDNKKPLVMGEFGEWKSQYSNITDAATALRTWQINSCAYNFQGWFTWSWPADGDPGEGLFGIDEGNAIDQALAPIYRANPCVAANTTPTQIPTQIPTPTSAPNPTPTPTPSDKPGDINSDGKVDMNDYNLIVSKFGNLYTIFDYNTLVENFGK